MPNLNISYAIQKIMTWHFQNKGKILGYKNIFQMPNVWHQELWHLMQYF